MAEVPFSIDDKLFIEAAVTVENLVKNHAFSVVTEKLQVLLNQQIVPFFDKNQVPQFARELIATSALARVLANSLLEGASTDDGVDKKLAEFSAFTEHHLKDLLEWQRQSYNKIADKVSSALGRGLGSDLSDTKNVQVRTDDG